MTLTYTRKQLAERLNYSTRQIDRLVRSKKIPAPFKPDAEGSKVLFLASEIDEWISNWSRRVY